MTDAIVFEAEGVKLAARPMAPLDRNLVFATWMQSARSHLKDTPPARRPVEWTTFKTSYAGFVESMLDRQRTVVLFNPDEPNVPHAWACAQRGALHWAYVPFGSKEVPLRRRGIGRCVMSVALDGYPDVISVTSPFAPLTSRFVFNPFLLRGS